MRLQHSIIGIAALSLALAPGVAFATGGSAIGLGARPAAVWEMDEAPGSSVMLDNSGNGMNGTVGTGVRTGILNDTGLGYRWVFTQPSKPPAQPERLVRIPDAPNLDPGSDVYSVSFRFRTTQNFGNYLQKGQATTAGGQFKVQAPKGRVSCLFKGNQGRSATSSKTPLNDGSWHVVTCRRDSSGVTMYVDGAFRNRNSTPTGHIDNTFPMTIGGKPKCDQITVTCDYFTGEIDWVRVDRD